MKTLVRALFNDGDIFELIQSDVHTPGVVINGIEQTGTKFVVIHKGEVVKAFNCFSGDVVTCALRSFENYMKDIAYYNTSEYRRNFTFVIESVSGVEDSIDAYLDEKIKEIDKQMESLLIRKNKLISNKAAHIIKG